MPTGSYIRDEKYRKSMSNAMKGRILTPEWKKKIRESNFKENSPTWKGNNASKRTIHNWLRKHNRCPEKCEWCGTINNKLALANIKDHNYTRDIGDYRWLCFRCHTFYDRCKSFCIHGHEMKGDNVLVDNRCSRVCKICRRNRSHKSWLKNKAQKLNQALNFGVTSRREG